MSANLRLVDATTGEVLQDIVGVELAELKGELARSADVIAGLQRDVRGWAVRFRELQRDRAAEAREHDLWPIGERVFREWKRACRHPRSPWTPDRFWQAQPFLSDPGYGERVEDRETLLLRAVAGAAFDPHTARRRNGSIKRYDDWDLIFRNAGKVEEFACRAPRGWAP